MILKKEEFIKRILEILEKKLNKILPDEATLIEMEEMFDNFLNDRLKGKL
jgi:hypothetical protein